MNKTVYLLCSAWLLVAIFSRLMPHPPDMTAMSAILVLAATQLPRCLAVGAVIATYIISNFGLILLGMSPWFGSWWWSILIIYGALTLMVSLLPKRGLDHPWVLTLLTGLVFWLLSNVGTWLLSGMYPHTLYGFCNCFTMALPFLPNQILGDALFASLMILSLRMLRFHSISAIVSP